MPALSQTGGLTRGADADALSAGFTDAPTEIRYRITSRTLPAPMQVLFQVDELSNGFAMNGQGVFELDETESLQYFPILQSQMGERVSLINGRIIFRLTSRLDEQRRAKEVAIFGISKWFQPNDCFAVLGECSSLQEDVVRIGRKLNVRTTEANGIWRARATVNGTGDLAYSTSYTVDEAGFLIDENRTEFVDGLKVRTTVRRMSTE
ncbi:MAG: hypothetical protein AAF826_13050 [Pseudomonadota bacterium]